MKYLAGNVILGPSGGNKSSVVPTTADNLRTLKNKSKLVPGTQYRITDYNCTTIQPDTRSADHPFDIIVTAVTPNILNENAIACKADRVIVTSITDENEITFSRDKDKDDVMYAWSTSAEKTVYGVYKGNKGWYFDTDDGYYITDNLKQLLLDIFEQVPDRTDSYINPLLAEHPITVYSSTGEYFTKTFEFRKDEESTISTIINGEDHGWVIHDWESPGNPNSKTATVETVVFTENDTPNINDNIFDSEGEIISYVDDIEKTTDNYFENANLEEWEIKYCIDDLSNRYNWYPKLLKLENNGTYTRNTTLDENNLWAWSYTNPDKNLYEENSCYTLPYPTIGSELFDGTYNSCNTDEDTIISVGGGSGVIYYMKDEWGNECPYDFKNIQFSRTITNGQYDEDGDNTWVYTFNAYDLDSNTIYDATIVNRKAIDGDCNNCYGNIIKPYVYDYDDRGEYSLSYRLNNNVFLNTYTVEDSTYIECRNNYLDTDCYDNTFDNSCTSNKLSYSCYDNRLGEWSWKNIFWQDCVGNKGIINGCILGSNCCNNEFNDCRGDHLENTSNLNLSECELYYFDGKKVVLENS